MFLNVKRIFVCLCLCCLLGVDSLFAVKVFVGPDGKALYLVEDNAMEVVFDVCITGSQLLDYPLFGIDGTITPYSAILGFRITSGSDDLHREGYSSLYVLGFNNTYEDFDSVISNKRLYVKTNNLAYLFSLNVFGVVRAVSRGILISSSLVEVGGQWHANKNIHICGFTNTYGKSVDNVVCLNRHFVNSCCCYEAIASQSGGSDSNSSLIMEDSNITALDSIIIAAAKNCLRLPQQNDAGAPLIKGASLMLENSSIFSEKNICASAAYGKYAESPCVYINSMVMGKRIILAAHYSDDSNAMTFGLPILTLDKDAYVRSSIATDIFVGCGNGALGKLVLKLVRPLKINRFVGCSNIEVFFYENSSFVDSGIPMITCEKMPDQFNVNFIDGSEVSSSAMAISIPIIRCGKGFSQNFDLSQSIGTFTNHEGFTYKYSCLFNVARDKIYALISPMSASVE